MGRVQLLWVVVCKNPKVHNSENVMFGHKIPLAKPTASPPTRDSDNHPSRLFYCRVTSCQAGHALVSWTALSDEPRLSTYDVCPHDGVIVAALWAGSRVIGSLDIP